METEFLREKDVSDGTKNQNEHLQFAEQLIYSLEQALKTGRWEKFVLPDIFSIIKITDTPELPSEIRGHLHILSGLYAFFGDMRDIAESEFSIAKSFEVTDVAIIAPGIWTSAALEAFKNAPVKNNFN